MPVKTKLTEKRTEWKRTVHVPERDRYEDATETFITQITIECRSFVCPFCKKKYQYFVVNGQIVHGVGGAYTWSGKDIEWCGQRACGDKVDKITAQKEER